MRNVEFVSQSVLCETEKTTLSDIAAKNFCTIEFVSSSRFSITGSIMSLVAFSNETGFNQIRLICKKVN